MGGSTEREFLEKLAKIKEKSIKAAKEIKSDFAKMEEIKAEALRKTEEMRRTSEHDVETVEEEMTKSKRLGTRIKTTSLCRNKKRENRHT